MIRLKRDPGRTGVSTGKTREINGKIYYQIRFGNGLRPIPANQIELVEDQGDLFERFKGGKLGGPDDLEQVLHHARISGRLSDVFYSMEATNTDFHPFQYIPILKILDSPSHSLLIADEVGLGKTIEAGLIWTELRSRFSYRNLLVICPAMLREKWRRELQKRFGVDATIVDAKGLDKELRKSQQSSIIREKGFALIASMQGLRSSIGNNASQRLHEFINELTYEEPIIDLLIIDEAHYLKNPSSRTHKMGKELVNISNYRLFLSATPIHLGSEDLFHLLRLLDESTFYNIDIFDDILSANDPLMRAIDTIKKSPQNIEVFKKYLIKAGQHRLLKNNQQLGYLKKKMENNKVLTPQTISYFAYKLSNEVNLLANSVTRTRKRDVWTNRVVREPRTEYVGMTPAEREAYSAIIELVEEYAKTRPVSARFLMVMPQKRLSSCMAAAVGHWNNMKNGVADLSEEENSEWGLYNEKDDTKQEIVGPLNRFLISNLHKIGEYDELRTNDSKYKRLRDMLQKFKSDFPNEKIIIFSFFKATLKYLHERLIEDGHFSKLLMGGMGDKDGIIEQFKFNPDASILLSSEVAAEGVDLQFSRFLINYDLPWNPMRIEQRIGRIDRIGQEADKITIWSLVYRDTIDELILDRLYKRLDIFRYALGDIEDVLGSEITKLTSELLSGQLSENEKKDRIRQTQRAIEIKKRNEEELEKAASHLSAHGNYIIQKIHSAKQNDQWIKSREIAEYVIKFLKKRYPNFNAVRLPHSNADYIYEIVMPVEAKADLQTFIESHRYSFDSRLINVDPKPVKCLFYSKITNNQYHDLEVINHLHPLVRWIGESIDPTFDLYPLAMIRIMRTSIPVAIDSSKYGYAIQSWTIRGSREHNQLAYEVLSIPGNASLQPDDAEQLIRSAIRDGRPSYDIIPQENLSEYEEFVFRAKSKLDDRFEDFYNNTERSNQDFSDVQERNCQKYYDTNFKRLSDIRLGHEQRLQNADPSNQGRFRGLIAATQKELDKAQEQYERRMYHIRQKRELISNNSDIAIGLIEVLS